jgi:hypothetical protein
MKKQAKEITVGKATKYKRVKFDVAKIIALYKSGKQAGCTDRARHRIQAEHGPEQNAPHLGTGRNL